MELLDNGGKLEAKFPTSILRNASVIEGGRGGCKIHESFGFGESVAKMCE